MVSQINEVINSKIGLNSDRKRVCGLLLVDEKLLYKKVSSSQSSSNFDHCILIGSVVLSVSAKDAKQLRDAVSEQVPGIPQNYAFLTNDGWPVAKNQEASVYISDIVNERSTIYLCKTFDKTRIGISTYNGENIGLVFGDYFTSLKEIRPQIEELLNSGQQQQRSTKTQLRFVDKNGWSVSPSQESILSVVDILNDNKLVIKLGNLVPGDGFKAIGGPSETQVDFQDNVSLAIKDTEDASDTVSTAGGPLSSWRKTTFKKSRRSGGGMTTKKVGLRFKSIKLSKGHPIMISYARQEASLHALNLKAELVKLGFSVYLDVHEIRTGTDWQDNLNAAVNNCLVFIPLVTPAYGKTQWTNREIKLADILHKTIIPVNFLDTWPPECLAIQFATTQYIPWKPPECEADIKWDGNTGMQDISVWPQQCLKRVAKQIAEQIRDKVGSHHQPEQQKSPQENDGKPLIVISVHPQKKQIALELKASIEAEGFLVWCSIELQDELDGMTGGQHEDGRVDNNHLSTISEEQEVVFNQKVTTSKARGVHNKSALSLPKPKHPGLNKAASTLSNMSNFSMSSQKIVQLKRFQQQVSNAALVVIVASESYYTSRTSQQHVYYCEHRKKVIVLKTDESPPSNWFSMLLRNEAPVVTSCSNYMESLMALIKRSLNPSSKTLDTNLNETKIQYLVSFLCKNLPQLGSCVYIAGGSTQTEARTTEICKAIGDEMAKVKNITLVTGGTLGASEIVAKQYYEIKSRMPRRSITKALMNNNDTDQYLVHILPSKDPDDQSEKYKQDKEKNLCLIPYGETMFMGESIKERDVVVSRLFDTCILIEGTQEDNTVAQEFLWNDHYVIPIVSTGGAASGKFGLPLKVFECPVGVNNEDWNLLSNGNASPDTVAKAVVRIVVAVKKQIVFNALSKLGNKGKPLMRQNLRASKRRRKATTKAKKSDCLHPETQNGESDSNQSEKVLPVIDIDATKPNYLKKWSNVQKLFSFTRK